MFFVSLFLDHVALKTGSFRLSKIRGIIDQVAVFLDQPGPLCGTREDGVRGGTREGVNNRSGGRCRGGTQRDSLMGGTVVGLGRAVSGVEPGQGSPPRLVLHSTFYNSN